MAIRDIIARFTKGDNKFKAMEREMRMQKKLEERQKNSNERELERFIEERRQEKIKKDLDGFRKQQQHDLWHGPNILDAPNVIKGQTTMLTDNKDLFKMKGYRHPQMFFK